MPKVLLAKGARGELVRVFWIVAQISNGPSGARL